MEGDGRAARYVAIITDGNGRWAAERGLPVIEGHSAGADVVKARLKDAAELGVRELTVYSFSTENWGRPPAEVDALMAMFATRIRDETPEQMAWAEDETQGGEQITLVVAFDYGGRQEILDAAERYGGGGEQVFRDLLYGPDLHDPDLVIRTSGEQRLSNYLLWQSAYAELAFRDELWPDYTRAAFEETLREYATRERRFGGR
jgi:undecaprenyl diphosphate synthase